MGRRGRPRVGRRGAAARQLDDARDPVVEHFANRPRVLTRQGGRSRAHRGSGRQVRGRDDPQGPVVLEQDRERERQVRGSAGERALERFPHVLDRLARGEMGGEVAKQRQPALADQPVGLLRDHAEHAADPAVIVVERAVGEGVVGLLGKAAALEEQQEAFIPGGLPRREHVLDAGADVGPDLGPHVPRRLAERPRVLCPERHPGVGVVVKEGQVRSPPEPHRIAGREHHPDDGAHALRPRGRVAEAGGAPVGRGHEPRELARSHEQRFGCRHGGYPSPHVAAPLGRLPAPAWHE